MKYVLAVVVVGTLVALAGCENTQLLECQDLNAALQAQVETANAAVTEKEAQIEKLKAENVEMQNTAMESISTMMTKQAEKDKQVKDQLAKSQETVKMLQTKFNSLQVENENLKGLFESAKASLDAAMKEKQALMQNLKEIQKAADTATEDSM